MSGNGKLSEFNLDWLKYKGDIRRLNDWDEEEALKHMKWHYIYKDDIKKVVEDGITEVGRYAFYGCTNLTNVILIVIFLNFSCLISYYIQFDNLYNSFVLTRLS